MKEDIIIRWIGNEVHSSILVFKLTNYPNTCNGCIFFDRVNCKCICSSFSHDSYDQLYSIISKLITGSKDIAACELVGRDSYMNYIISDEYTLSMYVSKYLHKKYESNIRKSQ